MKQSALFDAPGPRARRRNLVLGILGAVALLVPVVLAGKALASRGQFSSRRWESFADPELYAFLAAGLLNTVIAGLVALTLAMALGLILAVGRLAPLRAVSSVTGVIVQILRGAPVLLLMLFFFLAFPIVFRIDLPAFWAVVLALTLFNGAVISEIVRAGVLALPRGQAEAALALGMPRMMVLRLVLLPQSLRTMLPALVSQFVVLLKDTSLGFIIGYQELLQRGQSAQLLYNNPLQMFTVIGLVYVAINLSLSVLSHRLGAKRERFTWGVRRRSADSTPAKGEVKNG